jgi:hypothetical protein
VITRVRNRPGVARGPRRISPGGGGSRPPAGRTASPAPAARPGLSGRVHRRHHRRERRHERLRRLPGAGDAARNSPSTEGDNRHHHYRPHRLPERLPDRRRDVGLGGHHRAGERCIISRSRSGDAPCRCCSNNCAGSTLCGAALVVIPSVSSLVGTHQDHAVAVSRHDTTPLTSEELVHHLRGRSLGQCTLPESRLESTDPLRRSQL